MPAANWTAETQSRNPLPAYFVRFEGLATKDYSTCPILSPSVTKVICMYIPDGSSQDLTPLQGKATTGEARVRFIDVSGELTTLIATEKSSPVFNTLINRKITIWGGYRNIIESEYEPIFTGEIRDIKLVAPLTYEFTIADFKRRYEETLMQGMTTPVVTQVDAITNNGQANCTFKSISNLNASDVIHFYKADGSQFESKTIQSINTSTRVVTMTSNFTLNWAVGDMATRDVIRVKGNIINVFYSLLTNSFSTLATASYPLLDKRNSPVGLSLVDTDLDLTSFTRTRDRFLGDFNVDFLFTAPVVARRFFEQELYPLGFYPTVGGDGKLGIRSFVPPGPEGAATVQVNKEHMAGIPLWERGIDTHLNQIYIYGDNNLGDGSFDLLHSIDDTTDQTNTKEIKNYTVSSKGLRSGIEGAAIAQEIGYRIRRRWLVPPVEVNTPLLFSRRTLKVGDIVSLTHPGIPDTVAGTRGISARLMEVTRMNPDYQRGIMRARLLETGFKKFAILGPASMNDYGSATPDEKQFAYWGDSSNKVGGGTIDGYEKF